MRHLIIAAALLAASASAASAKSPQECGVLPVSEYAGKMSPIAQLAAGAAQSRGTDCWESTLDAAAMATLNRPRETVLSRIEVGAIDAGRGDIAAVMVLEIMTRAAAFEAEAR